jgi:Nucleoside-diphosphate-sugar pyrophosphorylase involved in lipopolysaccharide biosynthesis/translation initiation factor 2B, gamma/epsilon subunits (eIF-2Bgamma/eIF-2Bepsilon)
MRSDVQVVLLAGGMGKRLGMDIPKCLLKMNSSNGNQSNNKVTLLDICMNKLIRSGFREFILLLGYKAELVIKHIEDKGYNNSNSNIRIKYSIDPNDRLGWGKGKAFKYALMNNKIDYGKRSLITFPDDIILDDNIYSRFIDAHIKNVSDKGSYATIALVNSIEYPYGVAELDNYGNVISFKEKPMLSIPTSIGLYAFEPKVYEMIDDLVDINKDGSIELESVIFPRLAEMRRLASFFVDYSRWLPINVLKDYEKALRVLDAHMN